MKNLSLLGRFFLSFFTEIKLTRFFWTELNDLDSNNIVALDILHKRFESMVNLSGDDIYWPLRAFYSTLLDFFLWGFCSSREYAN